MLGATISIITKTQYKQEALLIRNTDLIFFSKNNKTRQIKKYTAAYLAIKAKPIKIPNIIKLIILGFSLIIKTIIIAKDQNSISKISVETKKEETETAGIKKNVTAVKKARFLLL